MQRKYKHNIIREFLKPDPQGYYIIQLNRNDLVKVREIVGNDVTVENVSRDEVVLKTRSRAKAKKS